MKLRIFICVILCLSIVSCYSSETYYSIKEIEPIRSEEYDAGYESGYESGYDDGYFDGSEESISDNLEWESQLISQLISMPPSENYHLMFFDCGNMNFNLCDPKAEFMFYIFDGGNSDEIYFIGKRINKVSFFGIFALNDASKHECLYSGINEDGTYGSKEGDGSSDFCKVDLKNISWFWGKYIEFIVIEDNEIYIFVLWENMDS